MLKRLAIADGARPAPSPHAPSGREMQRYQLAVMIAAVPATAAAVYYLGPRVLYAGACALAAAAAVEVLFAVVRRKAPSGGSLPFAAMLALVLPPTAPLWMAAAGAAFGALFGKEVFGGSGHYIFNPVLVAKAFLFFSFPQSLGGPYFGSMLGFSPPQAWVVCSAVTGAAALAMILARPGNVQILVGLMLPAAALAWGMEFAGRLSGASAVGLIAGNGFLFGACFLACDPATCPRGHLGKWLYGALIGLTAMLMQSLSDYKEGMLTALLLGNLFAPLLDTLTLRGETRRPAE